MSHVITFDGTNFPLWKLGLNVALEEHETQFVVDGSEPIPTEVHDSSLNARSHVTCLHRDQPRHYSSHSYNVEFKHSHTFNHLVEF